MRASVLQGVIAASLVTTPAMVQAQTTTPPGAAVQRLSLAQSPAVRAGAPATRQSNAEGNNWGWIIGAVGLVAGVAYALIEGDDDDDDLPASP
ncbi:hypothetical protein [Sphingomonas cavernae]|uniref:WGxxGxxG-CTERM domain-containing protein n=1 Tax=Sphingomonas cavernae TaxID=2320861 RepID=A0A418W6F9_9SPHN|nr:hypothetical protein [Sphingomonas cavernae]RJF85517.1 hypothetical protein D3876_16430 [Sphingomonas cavernae]